MEAVVREDRLCGTHLGRIVQVWLELAAICIDKCPQTSRQAMEATVVA